MTERQFPFPNGDFTTCIFDQSLQAFLIRLSAPYMIITDENVYRANVENFDLDKTIIIPSGEAIKTQSTVDGIIEKLLEADVDKSTWLIGVGGGVVTDIAGYVASVFKRGMPLALFPTSILGMVDAALGGKNGIDVSVYKNMVGTVYQPGFIVFDFHFLKSLPFAEWVNGFAEIIKHACISDPALFEQLEQTNLHDISNQPELVATLIEKNVDIKMGIVTRDEFERADRKLLNFGHTVGHAIEKFHQIPHGHAVSFGMVAACALSEKINGLHFSASQRIVSLLSKYHLPVDVETDHHMIFEVLKRDKKREGANIHFVLLDEIGAAHAEPVSIDDLRQYLKDMV